MANGGTIPKDILDALEKFNEESSSINDKFVKNLVSNKQWSPVIYHYTNDVGLRGILKTGKFWLTNIFDLNDPSELQHGLSHLIKAFEDKMATGHQQARYFYEFFDDFVYSKKGIQRSARFFVCSFSACRDDLGQWRAYADNGRGFAIGFDTKILEAAFTKDKTPSQENSTFSVIYDDSYLAKMQKEMVERLLHLNVLPRLGELDRKTLFDKLLFPLTYNSLYRTLYFKHGAYKNEQEYRFIQIHSVDPLPIVKTRSRNYSLIEYTEFDWKTLAPKALKEMVIGPSADKPRALKFAQACLEEAGIDPVKSMSSEIPYRA